MSSSRRDVENYLNEMPGILDIFGLDKSPDHTSFSNWDGEFPMQQLRRLLPFSGRIRERHRHRPSHTSCSIL
jgi:hypothetical protein